MVRQLDQAVTRNQIKTEASKLFSELDILYSLHEVGTCRRQYAFDMICAASAVLVLLEIPLRGQSITHQPLFPR